MRARDHMVKVKFAPGKPVAAILAGILIPGKDIVPAETNPTFGHPVIGKEEDHSRNLDHPVYQPNRLIVSLDCDLAPALIVKGLIPGVHGLGNARIKKAKSPPNRGNMDGQE